MVKPNYYDYFSCIAGECKHNCCIGWEICIDEKTLKKYKNAKCVLSEKLEKSIKNGSFVLTGDKRCPFLNDDNLCEIIINCGKNALCDICREHPRFYNFVAGKNEAGLGLSCEVAAKLILGFDKKVKIKGLHPRANSEERAFLKLRRKIFNILQNEDLPLSKRLEIFEDVCDYNFEKSSEMLLNLEKLSKERDKYFKHVNGGKPEDFEIIDNPLWQKAFTNLILYFLYRHFKNANIYKFKFALFCFKTIAVIFAKCEKNTETLIDIARVFSAEIEYSEENTEQILNYLMEGKNI